MILLIFAAVFSLITVLFVAAPIMSEMRSAESKSVASTISYELLDAKERILRSLKDLDLDFAMGKVSQDDYSDSKGKLSLEASMILEKLDLQKNI